jgi:hypothetical protein
MPKASLPKTPKGWVAILLAALTGLLSGFIVLDWLNKWWG